MVRKDLRQNKDCHKNYSLQKKYVFSKKVLVLNPYPLQDTLMALLRAKLGVSLFWHPCRKPPSQWEGAECGAAALTKQGRLQSVAHSRCTTQRHQRLTTRIGATPQTPFLKIMQVFRQTNAPVKTGAYIAYLSVSGVFFILEGELTYQLLKRLCLCRKLFGCGGAFFGSSRVCLYNI